MSERYESTPTPWVRHRYKDAAGATISALDGRFIGTIHDIDAHGNVGWNEVSDANADFLIAAVNSYRDFERTIVSLRHAYDCVSTERDEYLEKLKALGVADYEAGRNMAEHLEADRIEREALIKELVEALKRGRRKLGTYTSVYSGDKELRELCAVWDAVTAKAEAR